MCKSKDCQHGKESPIKDWKHRCKFGPDGKKLYNGTVIVGWNDMKTTHPALAKECLDDATKFQAGTGKNLNWKCSTCRYEWPATGHNRVRGSGCGCCDNKFVVAGINDIATTHPELAKELVGDPTKCTAGTSEMLVWKCSTCGHEWSARGNDRVNGKGCGCCSNRFVVSGVNDMATTHPELAKELLGDPTKYIAGTHEMLEWKCSTCRYEWPATGHSRVRSSGGGCSKCSKRGHDQSKASVFYIVGRPGQFKLGIMNAGTKRLNQHRWSGWATLDTIELTGRSARELETTAKRMLRKKGVPTGAKAFREKFDGYSEAWNSVDFYVRTIRDLCRKLGISLEAFLAA